MKYDINLTIKEQGNLGNIFIYNNLLFVFYIIFNTIFLEKLKLELNNLNDTSREERGNFKIMELENKD